ncbi:MAG: hypothetical protein ABI333_19815 [bacterium]
MPTRWIPCRSSLPALLALTMAATGPARAAEPITAPPLDVQKKTRPKKKEKTKPGFTPSMRVGLNFAFSQSQGVVGIPDGISVALGLHLEGGLAYHNGNHAWLTRLVIQEAQTKVPSVDPFIKGTDRIEISSIYSYRFERLRWLSLFGGVRVVSALLQGLLVRIEDTPLVLTPTEGDAFTDTARAQKPYPLTEFLSPLIFQQSVGVSATPVRRKAARLGFQLAATALEVWTQGGYIVDDDEGTEGVLELTQLRDYQQGGIELQGTLAGLVLDKRLGYSLLARVLFPFATSVDVGHSFAESINAEFRATLELKVFSWISIHYTLSVQRIPLITPDWQIAGNLMLNVTADIGGKKGR